MIRVTIHMRDGRRFFTDDAQTVRQIVPGNGRKDKVVSASGEEILHFQFVPWRTTIVEGESKICTVDSRKIEAIEAELIAEREKDIRNVGEEESE
nr:MAG TPA: hypothetical protein [Caudoviricetes sp.]